MECIPKFQALIKLLEDIKQAVIQHTGLSYHSQDARLVAIDSIQLNMATIAMWMNGYNSLANFCTTDDEFNQSKFLNSIGSGLGLTQTEVHMFEVLKLGQITLIHFKIENLFRNLLVHLNMLPNKKCGFGCLTNLVFKAYNIQGDNLKESLIVLTHIRNTLHNNGIHRHQSQEFQVGGYGYQFLANRPINCASWESIMNLLQFNMSTLQEILLSEKMRAMDSLVVDQFAAQLEEGS